jgi:hypothetical protein
LRDLCGMGFLALRGPLRGHLRVKKPKKTSSS